MAGDREEDDDPQLKSLRQVWLSMREEDPPTRGLDALMAAAHAEVLAPPPLCQRIVAMLRRPPVLALATVMILIGGAVILTHHTEELEKAPSVVAPLPDRTMPAEPQLHGASPTTPPATTPPVRVLADPSDKKAVEHAPSRSGSRPHPRPTTTITDDGFAGQNHDPMPSGAGEAQGQGMPNPEPKPEAAKDADKAATTPNAVLVEQLETQARSAAARGDCETARTIGARIAKQDADYYREHVAGELAKCSSATIDVR